MKKENEQNKKKPKKTTQFRGETKMMKENKEMLKKVRAFKGLFG